MAKIPPQIGSTLRAAGYDTSSAKTLSLGLTAYAAAKLLRDGRPGASADERAKKVGRNQPCPCGSGKKFKHCCLARERAEETSSPGAFDLDPALIPRFDDFEATFRDLEVLAQLLKTDPGLQAARFDSARASQYMVSNYGVRQTVEDPAEQLDELAQRYFLEVEGGKFPAGITDQLHDAATRHRGTDELRSLALGVVLCTAFEASADTPNPLVGILFRLSVAAVAHGYGAVADLIDRVGGEARLMERLAAPDPELTRELEAMAKALGPEDLRALEGVAEQQLRRVKDRIMCDDFPVHLPLASLLPTMVGLAERFGEAKPSSTELQEALLAACEGLGEEDLRLYGSLLRAWLDADQGGDESLRATVTMILSGIERGSLRPFDWSLVVATLRSQTFGTLPGEEAVVEELGGDVFQPESLELYAAFLESQGYVALARRTRELAAR